ncbi:hypothetical protein FRB93_002011 [Tulasnella sp. JGI-2019a]|nr:hypothetical protein FRB93_002011 [Tulasnella sp. JGI-2019a]
MFPDDMEWSGPDLDPEDEEHYYHKRRKRVEVISDRDPDLLAENIGRGPARIQKRIRRLDFGEDSDDWGETDRVVDLLVSW